MIRRKEREKKDVCINASKSRFSWSQRPEGPQDMLTIVRIFCLTSQMIEQYQSLNGATMSRYVHSTAMLSIILIVIQDKRN